MRLKHMSLSTERSYVQAITRYILFHKNKRGEFVHPRDFVAAYATLTGEHLAASLC